MMSRRVVALATYPWIIYDSLDASKETLGIFERGTMHSHFRIKGKIRCDIKDPTYNRSENEIYRRDINKKEKKLFFIGYRVDTSHWNIARFFRLGRKRHRELAQYFFFFLTVSQRNLTFTGTIFVSVWCYYCREVTINKENTREKLRAHFLAEITLWRENNI